MSQTINSNWHKISEIDVLNNINSSIKDGLNTEEVKIRQTQHGLNIIKQKKSTHPLILFLLQFNQPLVYILIIAGSITAILHEWIDSSVIFGVVLVNAIIGYVQEAKAIKAIEALAKSMTSEATVIRNHKKQRIKASELTIGDIVLLQSGDKIPADLRLVQTRELQIDESTLTGESVPVMKTTKAFSNDTVLADRTNMAYSSTLVTYGIGTGVVVAIGNNTEVGKINQMIASADILVTPLTKKITHFSAFLLYVIMGLALITFIVGILRGETWFNMFMASVALAVGAIPEGLPAALTITLAIGVSKLAKQHAIIRKLPAVETLGSTSVICSDKTGTLTQNQMTVEIIYSNNQAYNITGVGYAPNGDFLFNNKKIRPLDYYAIKETLIAGLLCNDSNLVQKEDQWKIEGDPTEVALITSAKKAGLSKNQVLENYPRIDAIPFESQHQYMATLHQKKDSKENLVYIKGSLESILSRCTQTLTDAGKTHNFNHEKIQIIANEMAKKGLRVLAFAYKPISTSISIIKHEDVNNDLIFLGLQAMIDPPRPEAITAVAKCKTAGITVKMITGDHELTALAIAKKIGIIDKENLQVLNGKTITNLTDQELLHAVQKTAVFARVAPEDKLRIVKALQNNNAIIAMTGDGVNDAPSLRQANIGIAMGITGTDVAKETADMILTDDNFASIEAAVEEGRGVYDNLIKFITWTLPTNLGEGFVILIAIIAGITLPILPVQILWINMTTAVLLGLMLAFEPKENGIMNKPPRPANEPILSNWLIFRIALVGFLLCLSAFSFYQFAMLAGRGDLIARTIAVNVFVFGELFYLFNCRSLKQSAFKDKFLENKFIIIGVSLMIFLQILFTYLPLMNMAFHSAPILLLDWVAIITSGFIIFIIIEIEKWFQRSIIKR